MISARKPIKVVLDTNVFISALLWKGIPHQLLKLIESGSLQCYATIEMLNEIEEVLRRQKFAARINELETSLDELMFGVISLIEIVKPEKKIELNKSELPVDKEDIIFLQCAISAKAQYIISGDKHLLNLTQVRGIPILQPNTFFQKYQSELVSQSSKFKE